jgi:hypothetical protein
MTIRRPTSRDQKGESVVPAIDVDGPDGQMFTFRVLKDRVTIGRLPDYNDIALQPDPDQVVSRKEHCVIVREAGSWWIVDNATINPIDIRRGESENLVAQRAKLNDGDVIRVIASRADNPRAYWSLGFRDPHGTRPADKTHKRAYLEYDAVSARLYRGIGADRDEIDDLSPQEHKLIRYMDQRNRQSGDAPVMCTTEEIKSAIWEGQEVVPTGAEVNRLVWGLRQKIERRPADPQFFQTVKGLGYRLVTRSAQE